jgi:hypothetical protein
MDHSAGQPWQPRQDLDRPQAGGNMQRVGRGNTTRNGPQRQRDNGRFYKDRYGRQDQELEREWNCRNGRRVDEGGRRKNNAARGTSSWGNRNERDGTNTWNHFSRRGAEHTYRRDAQRTDPPIDTAGTAPTNRLDNCERRNAEQSDPPIETFDQLMKVHSLHQRLEKFDALPECDRVDLLYPLLFHKLPDRDPYPEDWENRVMGAKNAVRKTIELEFTLNDREDSDEDSESEEERGIYDQQVMQAQTGCSSRSGKLADAKNNRLQFLENLGRCLPIITWGFHVDRFGRETEDEYCFCPCAPDNQQGGTVGSRWRKLCKLNSIPSQSICNKKGKQLRPKAFIDHLRSKLGCPFHKIVFDFLEELYQNFYKMGMKHSAFFKLNDEDDRFTKGYLLKRDAKAMTDMTEKTTELENARRQLLKVSASSVILCSPLHPTKMLHLGSTGQNTGWSQW